VLKAVVEEMDGAAEMMFGDAAGKISIGRRQDRDAIELSCEHQRFVPGTSEIGTYSIRIPDHDDAIRHSASTVPATENGGALASGHEMRRNPAGDRRLRPSADGKVADADHRA
jgi:hypothetical protein